MVAPAATIVSREDQEQLVGLGQIPADHRRASDYTAREVNQNCHDRSLPKQRKDKRLSPGGI
jgi:hypothetical protein